jgi:hypothetical protein
MKNQFVGIIVSAHDIISAACLAVAFNFHTFKSEQFLFIVKMLTTGSYQWIFLLKLKPLELFSLYGNIVGFVC